MHSTTILQIPARHRDPRSRTDDWHSTQHGDRSNRHPGTGEPAVEHGGDTIRVLPLVMSTEQAAELGVGIANILNHIAEQEDRA